MLSVNHKLSDGSLYLLHDIVEGMLKKAEIDIQAMDKSHKEEIEQMLETIAYYNQELENFETDITEKRKIHFQFSIEEIYYMYGQYDKFVGIEFHKFSEAAKKFGRNIGGTFVYSKSERRDLQNSLASTVNSRTNALVKIDASSVYKLTDDQAKELVEVGFNIGDIYEILVTNTPLRNSFTQTSRKEIPNTIEVKFNPKKFNLEETQIWLSLNKIKDGYTLLTHEYTQLYSNLMVLSPENVSQENKEKYLLGLDKLTFTEAAAINIFSTKYSKGIITSDESGQFNQLLKQRRIQRFEVVKKELGISKKQLDKFRETYPEKYKELYDVVLTFQAETLSSHKTTHPIYWDFERFIHIYLRHYENFFIETSTARGTHFQYSYKDIRRIACMIIEQLRNDIENQLLQGKSYAKHGEEGFYFNGNYYVIRIDSNGKLMQFHPFKYQKPENTENS